MHHGGTGRRRIRVVDPFNQPLSPLLGEQTAEKFRKHLGITTTGQALNYFPRRYLERGELTPINQLPVGEEVTVIARVATKDVRRMQTRKGYIVDVRVNDEASEYGLTLCVSRALSPVFDPRLGHHGEYFSPASR